MTPLPGAPSGRWQQLGLLSVMIVVGTVIALTRSSLWIPAGSDFVDPSAWTTDRDVVTAVAAFIRFGAVLLLAYAAVVVILTVATRQRPHGALGRFADLLGAKVVRAAFHTGLAGATLAPVTAAPASAEAGRSTEAPDTATLSLAETASMTTATPTAPVGEPATTGATRAGSTIEDAVTVTIETWTVEPGDHLWNIARETLTDRTGTSPSGAEVHAYWTRLIDVNQARLVDPTNPDLIRPGQRFVLP